MTKFDKIFTWFLVGTILLILLMGLLVSCKSSKDLDKSKEVITVIEKVNVDSIVKTKIDSVVKHYQEVMKSLDADIIFDCDTVRLPGEVRTVNKVEYIPGKGIVASGNIRAFKLKQIELIKIIDEITNEKEMEVSKRMNIEDSLKYYHSQKTLEKKTKSIWWLWYLLGAASLFFIYKRKFIFSLFKKVI